MSIDGKIEQAFKAFHDGDFQTAVALFEEAIEQTGHVSDILNHAFTLALYLNGDFARLAEEAFRIGNSIASSDPASAMDYFQRALFAGLDAQRTRQIGEIHEDWATRGLEGKEPASLGRKPERIAHVVGSLSPEDPATDYLKHLCRSLTLNGAPSTVFTTEAAASWFFNSGKSCQTQALDLEAKVVVASVDGDFSERAAKIADAIREIGSEVACFHGSLKEQITTRVAGLRPATIQISIANGDMDADLFDGFIYLSQNALERSRFTAHPRQWIAPASDIEERLHFCEPYSLGDMGLDPASSVSATFGALPPLTSTGYINAVTEILKRFPKHVHLLASSREIRAARAHLHREGVLNRVRFLPPSSNFAHYASVLKLYLAPFPQCGGPYVIDAMGAAVPVVAHRFPVDSANNSDAEQVGIRELLAETPVEYIQIADRLLRDRAFRQEQSQAVRTRFRTEFRPETLGPRYLDFFKQF